MYYNQIPSNFSNYQNPPAIRTGEIYVSNRGLENINCILPIQMNRGGLYLGDVVTTIKTELLEKHQIKAVLTCMTEPISRLNHNIIAHKILPIKDNLQFPIAQYFIEAKNFIDEARSKGFNVLVHCHAGVSRSAAIVCAYLMHQNIWNVQTALNFVRQKRYRAKPNANFINQLHHFWEHQLKPITLHRTQIKKNQIIHPIKDQKVILITLDQEVETHDELFQIELRKKVNKLKQSNVQLNSTNRNTKAKSKMYGQAEKQMSNQTKQKRIFKGTRGNQEQKSESLGFQNDKFVTNKSQIYFNKTFDPKLAKSNVQIKNHHPQNPASNQAMNQIHKKISLFESKPTSNQLNQKSVHQSISGSRILRQECVTPVKQKKSTQDNRVSFSNVYENGPHSIANEKISSLISHERTPNSIVINYGDKTPKNYSRYSLTGPRSSYKQFY